MYLPDKVYFKKNAKKNRFFPIYKTIILDTETTISAFLKLRNNYKYSYILESVEGNTNIGRYSFLGFGADIIFKGKKNKIWITQNNETIEITTDNPIEYLEKFVKDLELDLDLDLPPFYGGAVGYIGYDSIQYYEKIKTNANDGLDIFDLYFVFASEIIIFDKVKNSITILANVKITDDLENNYQKAVEKIDVLEKMLNEQVHFSKNIPQNSPDFELNFHSNTSKSEFLEMVEKGKKYIYEGDIFQVVLSQRFHTKYVNDDFEIYRQLRSLNPSPYMFYLKFDDYSIIGASPEVMVKGIDNRIIVRPIAGTRPRGKDIFEDLALEKELLADEKECAEHMMLVDLGRNDIGRVAKPNSVKVDNKMVIERYSHVMHIVSQISGEITKNTGFSKVFGATFPAGTLSGAPKIRAMEIIAELEKNKRGIYGGSIGYLSGNGNFDTCIAIRTILKKDEDLYIQAGAGIVADSVPENEFNETINKAKALFNAIAKSLDFTEFNFEYDEKTQNIKLLTLD